MAGDETESEFRISQGQECPSGPQEMCPGAKGTEKGPHQPGASYLQGGWCWDLAHGGAWEGVQQGLFMMWRPGSGNGGMCGSQGDVGGCAELGRSRRDGLRGCGNTRWPPPEPRVCPESNGKSQMRCAPRGPRQGWTQCSGGEKLVGRFHKQGPPTPTSEQVTVWLVEILFR